LSEHITDVTFADLPLLDSIQESIRNAGFEKPTPIQAEGIPPALEGKDVIGLAQTGTGKTAAFAIPIIQKFANTADLGALVIAPTRELAAQITDMFNMLGAESGIRVATIVGGVKMDEDYKALSSWPNVLVATPGRLLDHMESDGLFLADISMLAVDEADRMHDMGFIPQIRRILAMLPPKRQTLMFTATLPDDVERICRKSMVDPVRVQIGIVAPANRATQELVYLAEDDKNAMLLKILKKSEGRVLVFARTKRGVDRVARRISGRRIDAMRIHGDLEQAERDRSIGAFRDGSCRILVATDIAARGLDISNIEHVINYDFPHNAEDYVHRIGRTARVDASGVATSFVTSEDHYHVHGVQKLIGDALPGMKCPEGNPVEVDLKARKRGGGGGGRHGGGGGRRGGGGGGGRGRRPRSK
jgi:ATP-dependent RNA helicase RhlE